MVSWSFFPLKGNSRHTEKETDMPDTFQFLQSGSVEMILCCFPRDYKIVGLKYHIHII